LKRIFIEAEIAATADGFTVALDGKLLRTPAKAILTLPSRALAEAIAEEWLAQDDKIKPSTLPLTQLANTAIDIVGKRRAAIVADIAKYAGTELLCYRADHPPELVRRQQESWQPLLDWAALRYDAPLAVTSGVLPVAQPPASLAALAAAIDAVDDMGLVALELATGACGSLIVALALIEGRLDADAAFMAAEIERSFEIERWGEDAEIMQRRAALKEDIVLANRFVALLRA
jgi:chaperone required for assembly of F1-ATPase